MFVKFNRVEPKWHEINNTHGVSCLITFNSIIKSILNKFINTSMERCDFSDKLLSVQILKISHQVTIFNGVFANFIANVEKYEVDHRM